VSLADMRPLGGAPAVRLEIVESLEIRRARLPEDDLAEAIRERLRSVLVVQTRVDLVPWGSLQRSEYKSKLVEH